VSRSTVRRALDLAVDGAAAPAAAAAVALAGAAVGGEALLGAGDLLPVAGPLLGAGDRGRHHAAAGVPARRPTVAAAPPAGHPGDAVPEPAHPGDTAAEARDGRDRAADASRASARVGHRGRRLDGGLLGPRGGGLLGGRDELGVHGAGARGEGGRGQHPEQQQGEQERGVAGSRRGRGGHGCGWSRRSDRPLRSLDEVDVRLGALAVPDELVSLVRALNK
jgi:hypothetical protein